MNSSLISHVATRTAWLWCAIVHLQASIVDGEVQGANNGYSHLAPAFKTYCASCHGPDSTMEGDILLTDQTIANLEENADLTRKLIEALDSRAMPPEDEEQPADELRSEWIKALRPVLHAAVAKSLGTTRTPMRRMNRFQYNNAVTDLFQLNCIVFTLPERAMRVHGDYFNPASGKMPYEVTVGNRPLGKSQMIEPRLGGVAAFPQDLRAEHGYDNQGDHLSLSPLLMESFLKLGESITQSPDFVPQRVGIWNSFFAAPSDDVDLEAEIRSRLMPFLTKAFRRPVDAKSLDRYTQFALHELKAGASFTDTMKAIAAAAIASPRFLYLYDRIDADNEDAGPQPIDDFELASRLSFFLWGSLPDETLLTLAAEGRLSQPDVLSQQIDRLLKDKKLKRFCDSFPTQWLQLDRIVSSVPNRERFPDFYFSKYRLSMHMMLEPLLLFETVLIENQPITQLIDPDFTYRSALLEKAYGDLGNTPGKSTGGNVTVLTYQRQPVSDRRSGGVITNAAVMTMTSGPERTQPITRGAWMASVIFNDPPEPPPANVPPLPEKPQQGEENLTLRERLAMHRERADCRGCHEQIDPLGFALENYDPIGVWREKYENGREIDASGVLFQQHSFANAVELKDAIIADKDRFCRALAGHLLSFALARELGPSDTIALDEITAKVAAEDDKIHSLIREIILSPPFRTKS
ncbi:MAG: DUF1592 domain-containing protein [Planctomycetaceae bacterium]|nr:DUF1592 domain-containing protein [Planctomycetaceae bacterium]